MACPLQVERRPNWRDERREPPSAVRTVSRFRESLRSAASLPLVDALSRLPRVVPLPHVLVLSSQAPAPPRRGCVLLAPRRRRSPDGSSSSAWPRLSRPSCLMRIGRVFMVVVVAPRRSTREPSRRRFDNDSHLNENRCHEARSPRSPSCWPCCLAGCARQRGPTAARSMSSPPSTRCSSPPSRSAATTCRSPGSPSPAWSRTTSSSPRGRSREVADARRASSTSRASSRPSTRPCAPRPTVPRLRRRRRRAPRPRRRPTDAGRAATSPRQHPDGERRRPALLARPDAATPPSRRARRRLRRSATRPTRRTTATNAAALVADLDALDAEFARASADCRSRDAGHRPRRLRLPRRALRPAPGGRSPG